MQRYLLLSILIVVFLSAAAPYSQVPAAPCSQAYGANPPEPLPDWLKTDVSFEELITKNSYELLAGQLLKAGLVEAAECPAGGLNSDGSPNGCGLVTSHAAVNEWQNRYNSAILATSTTQNLPPKVLKAMIAVESQFWPGASWEKGEIGLGQMTAMGADLLLAWRPAYFQSICRQGLDEQACSKGYQALDNSSQRLMRGLVLKQIDATCPTCAGGVDPTQGDQAVSILAETLNASCQQTARMFTLAHGIRPAGLLPYDDFWRLNLANYHVGAGCIYQALRNTGNPSSWSAIAGNFPAGCHSGTEYIRRIEVQIIP